MQAISHYFVLLWGWRRLLAAILAGAVSALAMPPFDAFPVLWLTLPVLVWLIDGAAPAPGVGWLRRLLPAAIAGWGFGFGYFLAGLWWIGVSFFVDAGRFAWLLPLPVLLLPAGLALFFALGAALARRFWSDGPERVATLAIALALTEWLRGHLLTGFPWNALGYALTPAPLMMQSASVVGLWGLTLAVTLIFAAPLVCLASPAGRGRTAILGLAAVLFVAHLGFGAARLATADGALLADIHIRIVQPAIAQDEKWQSENADAIFRRYLAMSAEKTAARPNGIADVTYLVWPETAVPFLIGDRPEALGAIGDLLPSGSVLLAGAVRAEAPIEEGDETRYFNSVYALGDDGAILATYDKVHLVPFGEFLPFQSFLESLGLRQLTELPGGFSAGLRHRTIVAGAAPPFGPLICYEIIFPGSAIADGNRPGWLLNVTNDTWFGDTPGPRQHFAQARLRAVEEGLPLVRGANSGISAIVDAYGRIVRMAKVNDAGVIDGELPAAHPVTVYARLGDWTFLALVIAMSLLVFFLTLSERTRRN